jgi:transcriptional regulator with GAF, ATPase, and Fis domain
MNPVTNIALTSQVSNDITRGTRSDLPSRRLSLKRPTKTAIKSSKVVDCRIASLKALALTLLREIDSLDKSDGDSSDGLNLQAEVRHFETELIRNALITTGGRQRRAARVLGMKVATLNAKIKRYEIDINCANRQ